MTTFGNMFLADNPQIEESALTTKQFEFLFGAVTPVASARGSTTNWRADCSISGINPLGETLSRGGVL